MADYDEPFVDDDDIIDDYDDDEESEVSGALSAQEQEQRLAVFVNDVKKRRTMLRKPKDYPPKDRIEAAYWLGEAGDPSAIPELVLVYNRDKTPGMKEAAAYALGMFRLLEDALDDPEVQDQTYDTLTRIAVYGEFGKRAIPRNYLPFQIGLGISFVVLLGIGIILALGKVETPEERAFRETQESIYATETQSALPTPTPDTIDAAIAEMQLYYDALAEDGRLLREQMSSITRGEGQNCSLTFSDPPPHTLSEVHQVNENYDGYLRISTELNNMREALIPVREAFVESCNTGAMLTREEGLALSENVISAQNTLSTLGSLFSESGLELLPTEIPTEAPTLTPVPSPTIDLTEAQTHINAMRTIADGMLGIRGDADRMIVFWQQVIDDPNARSSGCLSSEPVIRDTDYDAPDHLTAAIPDLLAAEENINLGLQLIRASIAAFYAGCNSNDVEGFKLQAQQSGLSSAEAAVQAFTDARASLDALEGR